MSSQPETVPRATPPVPLLVEGYLRDVEARLSPLPPRDRAEAIREVRPHLMALLREEAEKKGAGGEPSDMSDVDSERAALARFGSAEDLSEDLIFAWRSARRAARRSLVGAAALSLGICVATEAYLRVFQPFPPSHSLAEQESLLVRSVAICWVKSICIGLLAGTLFPRRAAAGVALGMTLWWIVSNPVRDIIRIYESVSVWRLHDLLDFLSWVLNWIEAFFRWPWALPSVLLGVGAALLAQRVKTHSERKAAFR